MWNLLDASWLISAWLFKDPRECLRALGQDFVDFIAFSDPVCTKQVRLEGDNSLKQY